jgi:hypothetical protein
MLTYFWTSPRFKLAETVSCGVSPVRRLICCDQAGTAPKSGCGSKDLDLPKRTWNAPSRAT